MIVGLDFYKYRNSELRGKSFNPKHVFCGNPDYKDKNKAVTAPICFQPICKHFCKVD